MFFLVLNFPHFAIFVGKNGKIFAKSRKYINTKKIAKNLKEKKVLLMNKNLKVIIIIPTLNK